MEWLFVLIATVRFIRENMLPWLAVEIPVSRRLLIWRGICSKVTVLEFMDELKADQVLQEKAKSLPNVEIFVSSQTTEVVGNGDKVPVSVQRIVRQGKSVLFI